MLEIESNDNKVNNFIKFFISVNFIKTMIILRILYPAQSIVNFIKIFELASHQ